MRNSAYHENIKKLANNFLKPYEVSECLLNNLNAIATNIYTGTPSIDWINTKSKILGIATKLRINSLVDKGNRLESLIKTFLTPNHSQIKIEIIQLLLALSTHIYSDYKLPTDSTRINSPSISVFNYSQFPSDTSESNTETDLLTNYSMSQGQSLIKTCKNRLIVEEFNMDYNENPEILNISELFTIEPINLNDDITENLPTAHDNEIPEKDNESFVPEVEQTLDLTETEIINDVFSILLGTEAEYFQLTPQGYFPNPIKLSHLSQATLQNFLKFFADFASNFLKLRSIIDYLKCSENHYLLTFEISLQNIASPISGFISHKYLDYSGYCTDPNCISKYVSLINLHNCLQSYSDLLKNLLLIASRSIAYEENQVYKSWYLMSFLFRITETHYRSEDYLIKVIFFDIFQTLVRDLCVWMVDDEAHEDFLFLKRNEFNPNHENHSMQLIKVDGMHFNFVPNFIQPSLKCILAVGSYYSIIRQIHEEFVISYPNSTELYNSIIIPFKQQISDIETLVSLQSAIECTFHQPLVSTYTHLSSKILLIFNEKLNLRHVLKALQRIFFLQDPSFLYLLENVLKSFREKQKVYNISAQINNYFKSQDYLNYINCTSEFSIENPYEVTFEFTPPPVFMYIFRETFKKYLQIFHMLLCMKLAEGSIKIINKEYDCIKARKKFLHFIDCFGFYVNYSLVLIYLKMFNEVCGETEHVYEIKDAHFNMVEGIWNGLFLSDKFRDTGERIIRVFDEFNQIYYLEFIGSRYDIDILEGRFEQELREILRGLKSIWKSGAEKGVGASALFMLGFNGFYDI